MHGLGPNNCISIYHYQQTQSKVWLWKLRFLPLKEIKWNTQWTIMNVLISSGAEGGQGLGEDSKLWWKWNGKHCLTKMDFALYVDSALHLHCNEIVQTFYFIYWPIKSLTWFIWYTDEYDCFCFKFIYKWKRKNSRFLHASIGVFHSFLSLPVYLGAFVRNVLSLPCPVTELRFCYCLFCTHFT